LCATIDRYSAEPEEKTMSSTDTCPACSRPLSRSFLNGLFRSCTGCSTDAGFHVYRAAAEEFADSDDSTCLACREGEEPPREGLHCARLASGVVPTAFPVDSAPPYLDEGPAWMGNASHVLAASDEWGGLEGALTGLVKAVSRTLPGGAVAHVALFDGLDDATNLPAQLLAVFLVTQEEMPAVYLERLDAALGDMGLRPQGIQPLARVSPVPIVMARRGVSHRVWIEVEGAPGALHIPGASGGGLGWMATRDWERLQQIGGFADGDVRLENY
jgi:hypothetical protein